MEELLVRMRIKWQQSHLRMKHIKQRLFYCNAQLDLAIQNMTLGDQRKKKQERLVTNMIEILRRMEAELETLRNRWRQLKVEQRMREVRWGLAWRSGLLEGAPLQADAGESTQGLWLTHKMACKMRYIKKWKRATLMKQAALQVLKDDTLHHQQFLQLSKIRDKEMARLQNL